MNNYPNQSTVVNNHKRRSQTMMNMSNVDFEEMNAYFDDDPDSMHGHCNASHDLCIDFISTFESSSSIVETNIIKERDAIYQIKYNQKQLKPSPNTHKGRRGKNFSERSMIKKKSNKNGYKHKKHKSSSNITTIATANMNAIGPPRRALPPLVINRSKSKPIVLQNNNAKLENIENKKMQLFAINEYCNMTGGSGDGLAKQLHYTWDCKQVHDWVCSIPQSRLLKNVFEKYALKFVESGVNGKDLAFINGHILQFKLSVMNVNHQNMVLCAIQSVIKFEDSNLLQNKMKKSKNENLMQKLCFKCCNTIGNDDFDVLGYNGRHYHSHCFVCEVCGVGLISTNLNRNKKQQIVLHNQNMLTNQKLLCHYCTNGPFINIPQK